MGPNQTDKLLHSKENQKTNKQTNKQKRQLTEWEKIISNDATDKELSSNLYMQFTQLNSKKANNPNWKMGKRPE